MRQATTVEDTLRVRDVLSSVQGEIEQIKGRLNYLDEHSSYATLTVSLYETGMVVATTGGWGFIEALREAARALVGTVNVLIVFLGGALPVLVLLALIAWVVYVVVRATMRRRQQRRAEWAATHPAPQVTAAPLGAPTSPAADAGPAPRPNRALTGRRACDAFRVYTSFSASGLGPKACSSYTVSQ